MLMTLWVNGFHSLLNMKCFTVHQSIPRHGEAARPFCRGDCMHSWRSCHHRLPDRAPAGLPAYQANSTALLCFVVLAVRHYNSKNPAKMTFFFVDLPSLCSDPHELEMPGPNSGRRIRGCGRPVRDVSSSEGSESHLKIKRDFRRR